jgi:predicted transcriptional regulator
MPTAKRKPVTRAQTYKLVDAILDALDENVFMTREKITEWVVKNRKRKLRYDSGLTPTQIREEMRWLLDKLESGGRIGRVYYRKDR